MYNTSGFIYNKDIIDQVSDALGGKWVFGSAAPFAKGGGRGKTVLLHKNYDSVGIRFPVLNQGKAGTCTAFAVAGGVDVLKVTEIAAGERSVFNNITAIGAVSQNRNLIIRSILSLNHWCLYKYRISIDICFNFFWLSFSVFLGSCGANPRPAEPATGGPQRPRTQILPSMHL